MSNIYWIFESIRVVFAFLFILFVWPTIVFRKHLKAKSRTYCFAFCAVLMPLIVNTGVLGLGLLHILDTRIVKLLFWGILLISILKDAAISERNRKRFKNLFSGTYGYKSLLSDIWSWVKSVTKKIWERFLKFMEGHWFEYSLLLIIVLFGMIYFSVGSFEDYSYGCGDLYPHHAWTYYLTQGTIFYDGVYPEGMHCFVYCESVLFGIDIYNCLLFTAGIQSGVILISMFILFREMFEWKYTPYLLLVLFLTVDCKCATAVYCLSRWQWTLPQEFGYPAMFLCAAYLIRYLRENSVTELLKKRTLKRDGKSEISDDSNILEPNDKKMFIKLREKAFFRFLGSIKNKLSKIRKPLFWEEENLRIFMFGLSTTIICHFYTTIFAFFLCLCIAVFMLKTLLSRRFLPLVTAVVAGVIISCLPMVCAVAEGIPLQGSLNWAMNLAGIDYEGHEENETENNDTTIGTGTDKDEESSAAETYSYGENENINQVPLKLSERIKMGLDILYQKSFAEVFGEERANIFIIAMFFDVMLWLAVKIFSFFKYRVKLKDCERNYQSYIGYSSFAMLLIVCAILYSPQSLNMQELIEGYRICVFMQIAALALIIVPLDFIAILFINEKDNIYVYTVVSIFVIGIYTITRITGIFHGYLLCTLTRYNSAVDITNSIMDDMGDDDNFIIISTTDEYYQQIEHGYHEEIINFVNESQNKGYTLPAKYIYIYVEKNTIERAQYHVFTGPSWLADKKYGLFYAGSSQCPMINKEVINEEMSQVFFGKFPLHSSVYNTLWQREILMSKLYVWCQKFNAMYPNELHTYYEDDDFVCYYIVQNPRNLYELAVFDPTVMIPPQEYPNPIWPEDAFKDVSVAAG